MTPGDLIINGEIVLEGAVIPSGYEEWFDSGIITANLVRRALAMVEGDVVVRVNSGGGDPTEGEAIRAAIADHPANVTVKVAGDAMSAASLMIMGAGRIEMSVGSIMMIHDPTSWGGWTADGHRKEADLMDLISNVYAGVYASRSGKSAADVRKLMKEEYYMSPSDAVEAGFADAISGEDPEEEPAQMAMQAAWRSAAEERFMRGVRMADDMMRRVLAVSKIPTAAGGLNLAAMANPKEAGMPKSTKPAEQTPHLETPQQMAAPSPAPVTAPVAPAAVPAPVVSSDDAQSATMAERARQKGIREMAKPFLASGQLVEADVDALIDDGTTAEAAGSRFMAKMAAGQPPVSRGSSITITRDETDTRMEGMIGALMGENEGPSEQFRGLRLKSLAMELAGPKRGYNDAHAVKAGMMSTSMMGGAIGVSDFSYITTEVMNRSLIREYERRVSNWSLVTGAPVNASDFRELAPVRFGGDFQLKTVKENGEYQEATLVDEAEGLKVERRGRTITLTFEAVINDDMGAFSRIPREFAMAARLMEASMVWTLIRTNAALKSDTTALFHADHGNLGTAAALSATSVAAGRKAMWEQTAYGSKDADDFLMIEADILLLPPAKELLGRQFVTAITPAKDSDANPYKSSLTPHTIPHLGAAAGGSDTAWYLISSDMPPITHAYLDGYQTPTVSVVEGMNPDKVTMNARHMFGAAVTEHRGSFKNPGS